MKIDKNVVEAVQDSLTEFIMFVTSNMAEEVAKEGRVALKGQDLIETLYNLGF